MLKGILKKAAPATPMEKLMAAAAQKKKDDAEAAEYGEGLSKQDLDDAAVTIQSSIRCRKARQEVQFVREDKAALKIQGGMRQKYARQEVQVVREDKAATRIQGGVRMKKARQDVQVVREDKAALKIQGGMRQKYARQEVQGVREDKAATRIQGGIRMKKARHDVQGVREDKAALKIQGGMRQKYARKDVQDVREDKASRKIQSGHKARQQRQTLKGEKRFLLAKGMARAPVSVQVLQLQSEQSDYRCAAAISLAKAVLEDPQNAQLISYEGGVLPLLDLLFYNDDPQSQYYGATAIAHLAVNAACRDEMVSEGVLDRLVWMLDARNGCTDTVRGAAAEAIMMQAVSHEVKRRLVEVGAIPVLISALSAEDHSVIRHSARSLAALAVNRDNVHHIIRAGGMVALARAARHEKNNVATAASAALCNLDNGTDEGPLARIATPLGLREESRNFTPSFKMWMMKKSYSGGFQFNGSGAIKTGLGRNGLGSLPHFEPRSFTPAPQRSMAGSPAPGDYPRPQTSWS